MKTVLLAGETFAFVQTALAGNTVSTSASYANGALPLIAALEGSDVRLVHLASERCEQEFPLTASALAAYDAVILSDIGALTLLHTPQSRAGRPMPNRLALLVDYVAAGGGLMMAGGYVSFQGMYGTALYHGTPIEECLPVACLPHADGLEAPEGLLGRVVADHPVTQGLPRTLPPVLGLNKVVLQNAPGVTLLIEAESRGRTHPLLAVRRFGNGRTAAFTSDIGPHWMSLPFLESETYGLLMRRLVGWLAGAL